MDESVRRVLVLAGLAGAIGGGVYFGVKAADAEDALGENAAYRTRNVYKEVDSNLSAAQDELDYHSAYTTFIPTGKTLIPIHHPARYPDCIDAVTRLDNAVSWYQQTPEYEMDDYPDYIEIELRVDAVKDSLPRGNDIRTYRGEKVRNHTFEQQRDDIEDLREDIQRRIAGYDYRIPDDLKNGKSLAITGLVLSIIAGLGLAGAGLFSSDDYSWPNVELH